jgi:hypothetical protein
MIFGCMTLLALLLVLLPVIIYLKRLWLWGEEVSDAIKEKNPTPKLDVMSANNHTAAASNNQTSLAHAVLARVF